MSAHFSVGQVVTCQIGNAFDTSGFEGCAAVEILKVQERACGTVYLVKHTDKDLVGLAVDVFADEDYPTELACTNARLIGVDSATLAQASRSLGF